MTNFQADCNDSSDEHADCKPQKCGEKMFSCKNGRCIDELLVCNQVDNCDDNSDELDCPPKDKFEALICPKEFYKCRDSTTCIRQSLR